MSDDDSTPISRPRRSSASVSQWGIVEAWLAADQARSLKLFVGPEGLCVEITKEGGTWLVAAVGQHEDPSSVCVRGISKL